MADEVVEIPRLFPGRVRVTVAYTVVEVVEVEAVTVRAGVRAVLDAWHEGVTFPSIVGGVVDGVYLRDEVTGEGMCPFCGVDGARVWVVVDDEGAGAVRCGSCGDHSGAFPIE